MLTDAEYAHLFIAIRNARYTKYIGKEFIC
jgi:hypothetical protein